MGVVNKALLTIGLVTLSGLPIIANADALQLKPGNFYAGLEAGVDGFNSKDTSSYMPFEATNITIDRSDNGTLGGNYGIYLGYDQPINDTFDIALELNGNWDTAEIHHSIYDWEQTGDSVETNQTLNTHYGVAILPGINFTPAIKLYARLGVQKGHFKSFSNNYDAGYEGYTGTFKKSIKGYETGLGLNTDIYRNISLRIEYDHIAYNSFSETSILVNEGGDQVTTNYHPSTNLMLAGLSFKF